MACIAIITAIATLSSFFMGGKRNYEYSALGKPYRVIEEAGTTIVVSTRRWSETALCFAFASSVTTSIRLYPIVRVSGFLFVLAFVFVALILLGCLLMTDRVMKLFMAATERLQGLGIPESANGK